MARCGLIKRFSRLTACKVPVSMRECLINILII